MNDLMDWQVQAREAKQQLIETLKRIMEKAYSGSSDDDSERGSFASAERDPVSDTDTANKVERESGIGGTIVSEKRFLAGGYVPAELIEQGKCTYTVAEIADILEIGRIAAYRLANNCETIKTFRIGGCIRISKPVFDEWLDGEGA